MELKTLKFKELTVEQLYQLLKLRYDVFVFEQKSIYNEFDEIDYNSIHLFFEDKNKIVAYLRLNKNKEGIAHIGRVVVDKSYRKKGIGKKLVQAGIDYIKLKFKVKKIKLASQEHLKNFYGSFGFKQISEVYDDGGVPHVDMILE